jgi:hypothetical protein
MNAVAPRGTGGEPHRGERTAALPVTVSPALPPAEGTAGPPAAGSAAGQQPVALVDLLDRVLAGGVVIMGEVRLSIADVDLVTVSLQTLISSVGTALGGPAAGREPDRDR